MQHQYTNFWDIGAYRIIECRDCGFKHIDPLTPAAKLEDFYQHIYHKRVKLVDYDSITDAEVAKRLAGVEKTRQYAEVYRKVAELQGETPAGKMLDIGCGNSLLGKYFQNRGWDVTGIEPGKDAAALLRRFGLKVIEVFGEAVDALGLADIAFINLQFVLEHMVHPKEVLQKLRVLLKPGGIIRVAVPNDFSEGQLAYQEYYQTAMSWVCLPDHLNYFSFASLAQLLAQSGFQEVYRTTSFPLEFLLLGGMNYYADDAARQQVKPFVNNFENALLSTGRQKVLESFYEQLAWQGLGRSIFMYARKSEE